MPLASSQKARINALSADRLAWLLISPCLGLLASPLAAQAPSDPVALRDLIPDSAVAKPEEWARAPTVLPKAPLAADAAKAAASAAATNPTTPTPEASSGPEPTAGLATHSSELRPDSPLAEIPGLTLPWPEAEQAAPEIPQLEPDPVASAELAAAMTSLPDALKPAHSGTPTREVRDSVLAGGRARLVWPADPAAFPERESLEARFRVLSALQGINPRDADALTQVVVRGAADRKMLEKLLRVYGYYDGEVTQSLIAPGGDGKAGQGASLGAEAVQFLIDPGTRFRIGVITTGDLNETGHDYPAMQKALGLKQGDPLALDAITAGTGRLDTALGEAGYPFANVGAPSLLVDHAQFAGDLDLPVHNGGKYRYGAITSNLPRFLSPHHLTEIARFRRGRVYRKSEVDDLRRAILATGLAAGVTVTPREAIPPAGERPGVVALDVVLAKAPLHTITGELGYDTGEGFRVASSWEHRNILPPEGALKFRGILGTNEQLAGTTFRRSNFLGRDRVLTLDLYADNANLTAYAARKVAFAATYERQTTVVFQKPWTWSMGLEVQASEEREGVPNGVTTGRTFYITLALPLRGGIDRTDDLLDPRRGYRAALRLSPEESWARNQHSPYLRLQGDLSGYWPVAPRFVLAARTRLGSMPGTAIDNVAPSRRFYAGGGASIRGYGYELVGPRNALGEPKGGRSLYEFSIEARARTGLFQGALDLVPFLDAGGVETGTVPRFNDWRFGAGLGVRYRTGFGPIRVDVGTPLNPRKGDGPIGVYVALGQAF